jgi:hypothetical protein
MSKAYQFPQNSPEPNPFTDAAAPAPSQESHPRDNLYAAPQSLEGHSPYLAGYEQTAPHRGTQVLVLGLIGAFSALLLLPFAYFLLPLGLATLALSVPAWGMGRHDLAAMDAGAMDAAGKAATRAGWLLGGAGIWLALVDLAWVVLKTVWLLNNG